MSFLKAAIQFDLQQYASNGSTADKLTKPEQLFTRIATNFMFPIGRPLGF
jgi:hypothetical protein